MFNPTNIALKDIDFESMYRAYYSALCRYAEGIVKQKEDAEDIVNDIFMTLWGNRENMYITKSLKSYLYQCVHNNCLKFIQHKNVSYKYSEYIQNKRDLGYLRTHDDNDPESTLISQELENKMDNTKNTLPEQCRKIFDLVRSDGLKYKEVADIMRITIGTVRKQVNRAIIKLRKSFEK